MTSLERTLLFFNFLIYFALFVFSYSYVDLNLTISQNAQALYTISILQRLGYYNRPLATIIFVTFLLITFGFLALNLYFAKKGKIGKRYIFSSVILNTLVLIIAYPFLSYDVFNYMFDAKIISKYHLSPYSHKPLDFPQDEWLRFMRWTHRYSPYGPLWLTYSLIPSILGFGKFITTFLMFKIFIGSFHIINTFLIYKIGKSQSEKFAASATLLYSLNPVFLIEGIINAHNDIILASALLASVYFYQKQKLSHSLGVLVLGALVKYLTTLVVPVLICSERFKLKLNKISAYIMVSAILMAVFTYVYSAIGITVPFVNSASTQVQFQPWYLFWTLPLLILIDSKFIKFAVILISLGALFRYIPYLYYGEWSKKGTIEFMNISILIPIIFSGIFLIKYLKNIYYEKNY